MRSKAGWRSSFRPEKSPGKTGFSRSVRVDLFCLPHRSPKRFVWVHPTLNLAAAVPPEQNAGEVIAVVAELSGAGVFLHDVGDHNSASGLQNSFAIEVDGM